MTPGKFMTSATPIAAYSSSRVATSAANSSAPELSNGDAIVDDSRMHRRHPAVIATETSQQIDVVQQRIGDLILRQQRRSAVRLLGNDLAVDLQIEQPAERAGINGLAQ